MILMLIYLKEHWQHAAALLIALCLTVWIVSCEPTTTSLTTPDLKVTRSELQLELEHLQAKFALRSAQLHHQEEMRKIILQNALLIAETQSINPLGLITGLASLYGIASAAKDGTKLVKTKRRSTV